MTITSITPVRDGNGEIRYFRHGTIVTHWEIKHELPGRLRLKNPVIHRKAELCQAIERELMGVLGIDYFKTSPLTSTVLVQYDRKQLSQGPDRRDPRSRAGQRRAPRPERQARPAPAVVHGLGAPGRDRAVRGPGALARRRGAVCLYVDPDLQGGTRGLVRGEAAGRRRAGRDRRGRMPGDHGDFPGNGPLLVPELRPGSGQEDARQLQEAAAERLRQAAPLRLAVPRRRRGPDRAGSAPAA